MTRDLLVIMARYPTLGKVKTRLARDIGNATALRVYRQLLDHHRLEFRRAPFDVEWRYTPARAPFRRVVAAVCDRRNGSALIERRYRFAPQPTGDLGHRMQRIFEESLARGYRRVVMIGTDAPEMSKATVRRALRLLDKHAAVFQPTLDGGYALVGLAVGRARPPGAPSSGRSGRPGSPSLPDIFSDMPWSTHKVMAQTRRRLKKFGIRHAELPATYDVDTATDLARLA